MIKSKSNTSKVRAFKSAFAVLAAAHVMAQSSLSVADDKRVIMSSVGNSITLHYPDMSIGWSGSWGMAASSPDKDFTAVAAKKIAVRYGLEVDVNRINLPSFEKAYKDWPSVSDNVKVNAIVNSTIFIIELGDNAKVPAEAYEVFREKYRHLARSLSDKSELLLCVGTWWTDNIKDRAIRTACDEVGGVFVDISGLRVQGNNRAQGLFRHSGVADHPGDRGMEAIADRIVAAIGQSAKWPKIMK